MFLKLFCFLSIFGRFTLDVIAKAAFATKIDSLNNPDNFFAKKVKTILRSGSTVRFLILSKLISIISYAPYLIM